MLIGRCSFFITFTLLVVFFPSLASAHIMGDMHLHDSFLAGFLHPLTGLDHLLAMLSVGIISTQMKHSHAIWTLPATFIGAMVIGGIAGMCGVHIAGGEIGIALSVLLLGTFIFSGRKLSARVMYGFAAIFAFCHGYAHGAEMPEHAHAGMFVAGFIMATATIHLVGVTLGLLSGRTFKPRV